MTRIRSFIVNPRSIKTEYHCYDIDPENVAISVLETSMPLSTGKFTIYTVIDDENHVVFTAKATSPIEAIKAYIDDVNGIVTATNEDGLEKQMPASETVFIFQTVDFWETLGE